MYRYVEKMAQPTPETAKMGIRTPRKPLYNFQFYPQTIGIEPTFPSRVQNLVLTDKSSDNRLLTNIHTVTEKN